MYDNNIKQVRSKFLAVYPDGLKLCSESKEAFDPKSLCAILKKAKLYKFTEIKSFRFDPDEGDFTFVYKPLSEDYPEVEYSFKLSRVRELKTVIHECIAELQRSFQKNQKDLLEFE